MSSFGVSDAITAVRILLEVAIKLKNEGKELALIEKEIRLVNDHLLLIQTRMKNSKSPLGQADAKIKMIIEENCKEISTSCARATKILNERTRMHPFELGSKVVYIYVRIPELKDIVAGFARITMRIDQTIQVLIADAQERSASANEKAFKKLGDKMDKVVSQMQKKDKLAEDAQKAAEKKKAEAQLKKFQEKLNEIEAAQNKDKLERAQRENNTAKLVQFFKARPQKQVKDTALGLGDSKKTVEEWVAALVKSGMNRKDAQAGIETLLSEVRSESQKQKQTLKRAATDEAKKGTAATDPTTSKGQATAKNVKVPAKKNMDARILFVDDGNVERSVIAQAYLELVRVWTMNTQKWWLFERADSVGILVPTTFTKSTLKSDGLETKQANVPVSEDVIAAISGEESYFQTRNPDEKGDILKRIRNRKSQGLLKIHFQRYHHIICFEKETRELLQKMKGILQAGNPEKKDVSKIHYIDVSQRSKSDKDKKEYLRMITGKLKFELKKFLKVQFQWERPLIGIADGEWRTLQKFVPEDIYQKLRKDNGALINKVFEKKGCKVHIDGDTGEQCLLSISGPSGRLIDAQKMVLL